MRGLDDGPDGLNDEAFERALGIVHRDIKPSIEFEVKFIGGIAYHRYRCTSCQPHRVSTWLASAEVCAANAASHSVWHRGEK